MPVTLVTGGSRGIGRGIAERFAADGYDVAVNYRSSEAAAADVVDRIETDTDRTAIAVQADVADPDAVEAMVAAVVDRLGGLDHLVNNAGVNDHTSTAELTPEAFGRLVDVNLTGTYAVTRAALPHLRESTAPEGPSVVNLSSRLAHVGASYEPHYAASKAGVIALTKSHAAEFAPTIRVNAVAPGVILTDMTEASYTEAERQERRESVPLEILGEPADVAGAAAYLRDASFVTGETVNVNGGQTMR